MQRDAAPDMQSLPGLPAAEPCGDAQLRLLHLPVAVPHLQARTHTLGCEGGRHAGGGATSALTVVAAAAAAAATDVRDASAAVGHVHASSNADSPPTTSRRLAPHHGNAVTLGDAGPATRVASSAELVKGISSMARRQSVVTYAEASDSETSDSDLDYGSAAAAGESSTEISTSTERGPSVGVSVPGAAATVEAGMGRAERARAGEQGCARPAAGAAAGEVARTSGHEGRIATAAADAHRGEPARALVSVASGTAQAAHAAAGKPGRARGSQAPGARDVAGAFPSPCMKGGRSTANARRPPKSARHSFPSAPCSELLQATCVHLLLAGQRPRALCTISEQTCPRRSARVEA